VTDRAPSISMRTCVTPADRDAVRAIIASTGFFSDAEIDVAVELVDERLERGAASGYEFVFAERAGRLIGYACHGEIPCTVGSHDLYWIAVDASARGSGCGRALLVEVERRVAEAGGRLIVIETSTRPQYEPTRGFSLRCGYELAASIADFYAPGDGKAMYVKRL
jgi:GNAT superfamily N-acetyltransferase